MADHEVLAERVKTIRKARKLGRPKLAKHSGFSERQLAKIETTKTTMLSEVDVLRLSDALQVPPLTLTGDFPVTDDDLKPLDKSSCTTGCCG
jgi:transcriptional regulator with XRE-family HTH domain